jgi:two-component system sensor histidine kinase UhpB
MIATHPVVIAGGNVCRNPYHVPAEKYLSPDWPATEIDWLLDSIGHLQRSEDALRASEERYRALSRQLLDVQERERRSLALELHDEIGQLLTAVRMTLQGAPRKGRLADAVKIADRAMEEVRHLAVALRPPGLDQGGLPAALRAYLEQLGQRTGIDIRLHVHGMTERLASEVETACFRVVQEALTNVVRHSGARHVDVELSADGGLAQLVVRDDGKGFDVRAARRRAAVGASLGLVSMEERVTLVGGRLEIESERGRGTTIRARIPVPRAAA